jgi:DNA-binding winged helix-turn-helix (wHTH) protein
MSAKKQSKAKCACVDCHFISISQLIWEELSIPTNTEGPYELGVLQREQVRKKEDITIKWETLSKPDTKLEDSEHILACYQGVWDEFNENFTMKHGGKVDPEFRYRILVEEDRSDCIYFFKYSPSMSFKAADEHIQMELKQRSLEDNRMDSDEKELETVIPDSDEAGKESILVDSVYNLLKYKEKEVKIEPFPIAILELLYKSKNSLVTRKYILDHIWKESKVSDDQISDHIKKIRKAFKGLGYEKDIITTVRKSVMTEGGYRFNSNIVSLDFH